MSRRHFGYNNELKLRAEGEGGIKGRARGTRELFEKQPCERMLERREKFHRKHFIGCGGGGLVGGSW